MHILYTREVHICRGISVTRYPGCRRRQEVQNVTGQLCVGRALLMVTSAISVTRSRSLCARSMAHEREYDDRLSPPPVSDSDRRMRRTVETVSLRAAAASPIRLRRGSKVIVTEQRSPWN